MLWRNVTIVPGTIKACDERTEHHNYINNTGVTSFLLSSRSSRNEPVEGNEERKTMMSHLVWSAILILLNSIEDSDEAVVAVVELSQRKGGCKRREYDA